MIDFDEMDRELEDIDDAQVYIDAEEFERFLEELGWPDDILEVL
jgi:hypothetical protein